ncbi:amino acid adenylation domain-containing protein [Nocardia sp. NPDC020380]|uniref:amino acid adenylation domain-containing protein n=1 Tax=Nocardia sp. NPDC020380 TaxID=3364309 RepID=UPI0037A8285C
MDIAIPATTTAPTPVPPLDLIRARAAQAGDRIALGGDGRLITYRELLLRTDALAHRLRTAGVTPQLPVAVHLDDPADTVVAMLATFTVGAVYCPLDTAAPADRLAAIITRLRCRFAIADVAGAHRLPATTTVFNPAATVANPASAVHEPETTVVDPAATVPTSAALADHVAFAHNATPHLAHADELAYVIHTSGSTGIPKGVAMTRRGLARLIDWQVGDGETGLRTLQFTAASFDVTFQEVLSTLASGGTLIVSSVNIRRDPAALLDALVRHRIERLFLPYVALQLLAVEAGRRGVFPDSLRQVVTAGERLIITPAIRALFAALPGCRLDNHYGPTEAHLVTSATLRAESSRWPEVPDIGAPVSGVSCRVLDDRLRTVPAGEAGELYVGGSGLARGYAHDPARTAERFVASPFAPGERLYRTGDLVRAAPAGHYEFLGRADDQLKVRGFRVEPGEVEHALSAHPSIDAAAVDLRLIADGVRALVAYIQTTGPISHRELGDQLRATLPAYMIPSRFIPVDILPRTTTGKIDRRALAALPLPTAPGKPATPPPRELPQPSILGAPTPSTHARPSDLAAPISPEHSPSRDLAAPVRPEHSHPSDLAVLAPQVHSQSSDLAPPSRQEPALSSDAAESTLPQPASAPSPTELVTGIWIRVLGHDEFAGNDDFFDVGGDSLLATWVVTELAQVLGRPVELSLLLEYGTVDELAAALESADVLAAQQRFSQIVTLRPGNSGRTVYFVHPLGGELLAYRELALASTAPMRLLGIGWTGASPKFGSTLADIAHHHVEQLRVVEPDGPYWLAGWSFGGVLAFEIARQLRAAGAEVAFLGLFDANPVIDPITGLPMGRTPFLEMLDTVAARLDDPSTTDAELTDLTSGPTWLQLMGAPLQARSSTGYLRTVLDTARACMNAAMRYEPQPYSGPVHLFDSADTPPERRASATAAMRELCIGSLTIVEIAGAHRTFITGEHAAEAAAQLDAALERVGAEGSANRGSEH